MLEIKFAALRDRLYIERMEEAAAEEEMIHDGTHPALTYLYKTLAGRREKLHEVASRRHQQTLEELVKAREAEKDAVWTWWTVSAGAIASLLHPVAESDAVQHASSCVRALTHEIRTNATNCTGRNLSRRGASAGGSPGRRMRLRRPGQVSVACVSEERGLREIGPDRTDGSS